MAEKSFRLRIILGTAVKFAERFAAQVVSFIVSIILARILLPDDYGIIALVTVFISLCDKLVTSGFPSALVQKKNIEDSDYSTVLIFSTIMSLLLYTTLFLCAPFIADFYSSYNKELLTSIIRVMGVQVVFTAINSIPHAYTSKNLQFKKSFIASMLSMSTSAVVGIVMAYLGYGIWALVAQTTINVFVNMIVMWIVVKWKPGLNFSFERFKGLFSYGWKIFVASMIKVLYNDLRSIVIGKTYTPADLAFYNKGQSFPQLIESNVGGTIDSVLFPAISQTQDSKEGMLALLRRAIKTSTYALMPMLMGLAAVAEPLVKILLTEKWLPCVPYMQIMCFTFMLMPVEVDNLQAIKAMGRSGLALKLEIIKKSIGVSLLIIAIPLGVKAIALSMLIGSFANAIVDAVPNRKLLGYKFSQQILDILPNLILSTLMFGGVYALSFIKINLFALLAIQIVSGVTIYLLLSIIFRVESLTYILNTVKSFFKDKEISKNES